jgi:hypothetical protein
MLSAGRGTTCIFANYSPPLAAGHAELRRIKNVNGRRQSRRLIMSSARTHSKSAHMPNRADVSARAELENFCTMNEAERYAGRKP